MPVSWLSHGDFNHSGCEPVNGRSLVHFKTQGLNHELPVQKKEGLRDILPPGKRAGLGVRKEVRVGTDRLRLKAGAGTKWR